MSSRTVPSIVPLLTLAAVAATSEPLPLDAGHNPPLLALAGEPVVLAFDPICPDGRRPRPGDGGGDGCRVEGELFVRPAGALEFARLPLAPGREGAEHLLVATVPVPPGEDRLTGGAPAIEYYARLSAPGRGSMLVPAGGARAPQRVWLLPSSTPTVLLPVWQATRLPDRTVVRAGWGDGRGQVGLEGGNDRAIVGPSSFDVAADGSIHLLDQLHRRLLVHRDDGTLARTVELPSLSGCIADFALDASGTMHVLDLAVGHGSRKPTLRTFDSPGTTLDAGPLAERSADMIRIAGGVPVVHQYPSDLWMPARGAGRLLLAAEQVASGRPGRPADAGELIVKATPREARAALVEGHRVRRAIRLVPAPGVMIGEVQLAELRGGDLVVVLREWRERYDASTRRLEQEAVFRLLAIPDGAGPILEALVDTADWAESAPVSRFRLGPAGLYQLRTSPAGLEIGLYELGR